MPKKKSINKSNKPNVSKIKAHLSIAGRVSKAEGNTILEAVMNLKPSANKGVGVLVLEKGKYKKDKILKPDEVYGLFGKVSETIKQMAIKKLLLKFDRNIFK